MAARDHAWSEFAALCDTQRRPRGPIPHRRGLSRDGRAQAAGGRPDDCPRAGNRDACRRRSLPRGLSQVRRPGSGGGRIAAGGEPCVQASQAGGDRSAPGFPGCSANASCKVGAVGRGVAIALSAGGKIFHQADTGRHAHGREAEPGGRSDCLIDGAATRGGTQCWNVARRSCGSCEFGAAERRTGSGR